MPKAHAQPSLEQVRSEWQDAWPQALEAWSRFTRLRLPLLCLSHDEARREGLDGSFAMIRLMDQAIVVNLPSVIAQGVHPFALEVLAHEIGHHVLAPGNLTDHARCIARIRWALPTLEAQAPMVANLYTDLLINDRLQRSAGLRIAEVYRTLGRLGEKEKRPSSAVWCLYLRIYEILWNLERGSLGGGKTDDRMEGDAWLGARVIRSYARDWLRGAGRFGALLLPHLMEDREAANRFAPWHDTKQAGTGSEPDGLVIEDPDERSGAIHPAADPELSDDEPAPAQPPAESAAAPSATSPVSQNQGQARQPFEYGEILRAAGINLTDHEVAVRYYRERARPYLVPFPSRTTPPGTDPLPEGLEPWDLGHPIDAVDWLQTVLCSPKVIPGMTTVQRRWGTSEGVEPKKQPFFLDLYVDCSGSMPNPQHHISFLALAGAILCLSALRAGSRVQATLWSGKNQFTCTDGFVRDEDALLRVLTGYYGGGTQFPLHVLRETYAHRRPDERPAHLLIVSDDGVSTLFDQDEKGNSGWDISARALAAARGGGTMVLNLAAQWETFADAKPSKGVPVNYLAQPYAAIKRARDTQGWQVHRVAGWEDLVQFARDFSRRHYAAEKATRPSPSR